MSFIVFGHGVADRVPLTEAFEKGLLREPEAGDAVARVHNDRRPSAFDKPPRPRGGKAGGAAAYEEASGRGLREPGPVRTASQIMSEPVQRLDQEAGFEKTREFFAQHPVGMAPLVRHDGRLAGIVTRGDMEKAEYLVALRLRDPRKLRAVDIGQERVIAARPDTNVRELARVLLEQGVHGMPLVDETDRLVGVATRSDILRALVNYAPMELWL
ncbi:MAG: HPP family protein [Halothiobacillaceae bacterium]